MEIIWSRGTVSASDVQDALEPQRSLRSSTVRTILTRLEDKGYVAHEISGRTFLYTSLEPPGNLAVKAVKQIVDRFCRGSVESLLVGMVDGEMVNPAELQRIVDRLTTQKAAQEQPSKPGLGKRKPIRKKETV